MSRRPGFTMIELLAVVLLISTLIALLLPAVQSAREAARRTQCVNNLSQLGIAARNYESTFRVLPPGTIDSAGPIIETPTAYQFSWICQLLPFLEQRNVNRHLDFNRGVYQPANITARGVSMSFLLCPSQVRSGKFSGAMGSFDPATTSYAACHHDVEGPIDSTNRGVFFLNSNVKSEEIEDGLSHTIFFGEKLPGGDELGWASGSRATLRNTGTPINRTKLDPFDAILSISSPTSPDDAGSTQQAPNRGISAVLPGPRSVGGFGGNHPGGANFCFGDGSVRFLKTTISDRVYRLLGSRDDGEPIGDDQF
ncbi:DUF1559 domain-containing protein [Tundrisphaera lichenicola]|uniref:DUF1559 family PulG-like putative transporter n=1 Tax=Tundrisphaera lichenicola TaxID=2029860 RepID=UPI003EB97BF1